MRKFWRRKKVDSRDVLEAFDVAMLNEAMRLDQRRKHEHVS